VSALALAPLPSWGTTLTLQSTARQEIKGWGLTPSYVRKDWGEDFHILDKPSVQQAIYNDLNYNYVRVDIQSTFYDASAPDKVNTSALDDLRRHLQIAQIRGKSKWIASVWTPPAAFKTPQVTWGIENEQKVRLNPDKVDEFTEYLVGCLKYLQSRGVGTPELISPQNEPDYAASYDSCYYGDSKDVYQRVVKSLRSRLNAAGLHSVKIGAADAERAENHALFLGENFVDMSRDASLRDAIGAITTHSYDDWNTDEAGYDALVKLNNPKSWWGKSLWQTEYSLIPLQGESLSEIEVTLNTFTHLARDLVMSRYEYWFWWFGYNKDSSGKSRYGNLLWGDPVQLNKYKNYHVFQKLWASVPPASGFKVQSFTSDDASFVAGYDNSLKKHPVNYPDDQSGNKRITRPVHMIAFTNGKKRVFYLVNDGKSDKAVDIRGILAGGYNLYQTTVNEDMVNKGILRAKSGGFSVTLPQQSVSLFVSVDDGTTKPAKPVEAGSRLRK
jgi:O-glycosyl hydrolase